MTLTVQTPRWLDNYAPGYIGFSYRTDSPILSPGIAYFTRWDRLSSIRVTHSFIVSGPDHCLEALPGGVRESSLQARFEDPNLAVFFRKPVRYSLDLGCAICRSARAQIGVAYDYRLIAGQALVNTWLFHRCLSRSAEIRTLEWFDNATAFICSELAAFSLDAQPELHDLGCLADPHCAVSPQILFEDPALFQPWKSQTPHRALRSGVGDEAPRSEPSAGAQQALPGTVPPAQVPGS